MKINYERTVPITPQLENVKPGELFRPVNTERIFMRTSARAGDEFTSEHEARLRKLFDDIQHQFTDPDDMDYEDLVFCADMETGKLVLLHLGLKVEKLIGELMIKER